MKMQKSETKAERDAAIKSDASAKPAVPGDQAPMTK